MRPIPSKLRNQIAKNPWMKKCCVPGCGNTTDVTWEHALKWAGRQINEAWAIIPLCWHHHLYTGLDKRFNEWVALHRATDDDLAKYPKHNWFQDLKALDYAFKPIFDIKKILVGDQVTYNI